MEERRKLERFILVLPTTIEIVEPNSFVTEISSEYLTRDVSSGGAFFLTPDSIPVGTRVKAEMTLKAETLRTRSGFPRMKTRGYVVRTEPDGMAVCFNGRCRLVPSQ
jgi:hypothetical protein